MIPHDVGNLPLRFRSVLTRSHHADSCTFFRCARSCPVLPLRRGVLLESQLVTEEHWTHCSDSLIDLLRALALDCRWLTKPNRNTVIYATRSESQTFLSGTDTVLPKKAVLAFKTRSLITKAHIDSGSTFWTSSRVQGLLSVPKTPRLLSLVLSSIWTPLPPMLQSSLSECQFVHTSHK